MTNITLEHLRTKKIKTGNNGDVVKFIEALYDSAAKMRLKQEKDWYLIDRFVRGDHWLAYNRTTNRLENIPISQGEIRRTVNKVRTQLRGTKNFIKRSQPRWEVHPKGVKTSDYEVAKGKNKILQNLYRKNKMNQKMTDVVVNSLKNSVGILEGGVIKENGKEKLSFWVDSTYDVLIDPYANDLQNARFIFKTFAKPVEAIKGNKDYDVKDTDNLADNKEAASEFKDILEREEKSRQGNKNSSELETAIVKELWLKWEDNGETKIKVITIAGNNVLQEQTPKYRRYPMFAYSPERVGDSFYGQPWLKDLIPLNKSLDKMASQIEAYVQRMLAGKWLIKQGTEVSTITDKGAEKIFYKGNVPPRQMDLQTLPSTPLLHTQNLERWLEELGGVRDASLGRASGSIQSGKGLEALQSADAGTVAEPIENLELFLKDVAEFSLEVIADYNVASETIIEDDTEVKFVGKVADANLDGAIEIDGKDEVKAIVVPEVSYSESEKKEWTIKLAEAGLIDKQTLLEQFQFSNVAEIIERMNAEKAESFKQDMIKQQESHRTQGEGPKDTADLADQENMGMAAGQKMPMTPKVLWTPEHTDLHLAFIRENDDAYQQNKQLFDDHINNEATYK